MTNSESLFYMREKICQYTIITARLYKSDDVYTTCLYDDEICLHQKINPRETPSREEAIQFHNCLAHLISEGYEISG